MVSLDPQDGGAMPFQQNFSGDADLSAIVNDKLEWLKKTALKYSQTPNFRIEIGPPGQGACWDEINDIVFIDPVDLASAYDKKLEYQIAHELAHREITRHIGVVPAEVDNAIFRLLANCIEEGRVNNYRRFHDKQFDPICDFELKEKFSNWQQQLFECLADKQAPFANARICCVEFFNQWYNYSKNGEYKFAENLPESVKQVLEQCLPEAQNYWASFPAKGDTEYQIQNYAKNATGILIDKIYPHLLQLLYEDLGRALEQYQNAKSAAARSESLVAPSPQELQQMGKELLEAFMDELSEEVSQSAKSAKKYQIVKNELNKFEQLAEKEPAEALNNISSVLEASNQSSPEFDDNSKEMKDESSPSLSSWDPNQAMAMYFDREDPEVKKIDATPEAFFEVVKEQYPEINKLERRIKRVFDQRRQDMRANYSAEGNEIDINVAIEEKALGIPPAMSEAWYTSGNSLELDYGFSILIDLSGSMKGSKIYSAFRSLVIVANALNKVGVPFEITGFNTEMHEFKNLKTKMSDQIRKDLSRVLDIVRSTSAQGNNDGYALYECAMRLNKFAPANKFLIIISDGLPSPTVEYNGDEWKIPKVLSRIKKETNVKVIGVGIGKGTEHVEQFYSAGKGNIEIAEFAPIFCGILEQIIKNPRKFK